MLFNYYDGYRFRTRASGRFLSLTLILIRLILILRRRQFLAWSESRLAPDVRFGVLSYQLHVSVSSAARRRHGLYSQSRRIHLLLLSTCTHKIFNLRNNRVTHHVTRVLLRFS